MPVGLGLGIGVPFSAPASDAKNPIELDTPAVLWLDGADDDVITVVSDNVAQWDDKSGNDYHFAQSLAADRPARIGSTVDFDEANDEHLDGSNAYTNLQNLWLGGGGYAVFVVNYDDTGAGTVRQIYTKGSFTQISIFNDSGVNNNTFLFTVFFSGDNGQWKSDQDAIPVGEDVILEVEYNGGGVGFNPIFRVNGVVVTTTEITAPTGTMEDDGSLEPDLGGSDTTLTFNGEINEVSLFSLIPSAEDQASLRKYLANKRGIAI